MTVDDGGAQPSSAEVGSMVEGRGAEAVGRTGQVPSPAPSRACLRCLLHPGCPWGRRGAGDGAARCRGGRGGGHGRGLNFGSDPALSLARELQHKMQ